MITIRFKRITVDDELCPFHTVNDPTPAVWSVCGQHRSDPYAAVLICNDHAISQLGALWALGDRVLIDGTEYEMPEPFASAPRKQAR